MFQGIDLASETSFCISTVKGTLLASQLPEYIYIYNIIFVPLLILDIVALTIIIINLELQG